MPYIYKMSNAGGMSTLTRYADMLAGNTVFVDAAYDSIATTTVGAGGASSITFSSIPSSYTHLQIRFMARRTTSSAADTTIRFNSDSGANYKSHYIIGDGASVSAGSPGATTSILNWYTTGSDATSGVFGIDILDILDYSNTNKYKTTRTLSGFDNNGSGNVVFSSGLYLSTNAISNITLIPNSGNFVEYSSFALYGIKG